MMPTPEFYIPRSTKKRNHRVEALRCQGSNAEWVAAYEWVERNSAGSFDVNTHDDPIPTSGVSIDAATGGMVVATRTGVLPVREGDWVVKLVNGEFAVFDDKGFHDTYVKI